MADRILVVDDDPTFRRHAARALREQGWTVDEADTADAALALARKARPQVILLDFVLPDADGLVLLDALREWGVDAPVIALSGSDSPEVATRFARSGVLEFVHKDRATPDRIVYTVRRALRSAVSGVVRLPEGAATPAPPQSPPRAPDEPAPDPLPDVAGARALLVDDTEDSRFLLRRLLEPHGWLIEEAATGADALWRASLHDPDIILLDYLLPDIEGVTLIGELRRRGVRAPILALTGHGDEKVARAFVLAGAADFLSKDDLTQARLLAAMRSAMAARAP